MAKNYKNQKATKQMSDEEKISLFRELTLVLLGLMFIFFFFGWCYVFNTDAGVEVNCNGWNFICMSFCWNFKSSNKVFGDIAVPFHYYAKYWTITLTILTTIIFYFTIGLIVLACLNIKKLSKKIMTIFMYASFVYSALFLASFIVALTMNASRILPQYCSGNPKCSIQSLIIFPLFLSIGIMIVNIVLRRKVISDEEQKSILEAK